MKQGIKIFQNFYLLILLSSLILVGCSKRTLERNPYLVDVRFQKEINLSLLIGVSMILNMIVAGLFGILVPVSLKKLNIDPALASSVFVTTITDVIGFLSFLGLGSYYFLG